MPDLATGKGTRVGVLLVPLMLVLFISNLDQTIVATALPSIARDLGDAGGASWIATAYLLTSAVTTLLFGKLGDLHGRKPVFLLSVVIFLVGSVLAGAANSLGLLIAFRALQGIGGGGLNSLVMAIIGDVVPARERGRSQSLLGVVATLALIAGPFLGGLFSDALSWRWIFYVNVPVGVVAIVAIAARLHLPKPVGRGRVDVLGGVLVTVATTAVLLVATLGPDRGWTTTPVLALIAVAVVSLLGYVLAERRAAEPITPLPMFRNGVFVISAVQFFLSTLVLFVAMLYVPLFLQTVRHASAFTAGLYVIPLLVGLVAATAVAGPVIAKTGRYKRYPVIGALLTGPSMAWLAAAPSSPWLIAPLVLAGAGIGFFVQVSLLAGQNAVAYRDLGVATGALNFFKSVGGGFGAAVFGAVLTAAGAATAHGFSVVFLGTVPIAAVMLVLALVMREKPLSEEMREIADGTAEAPEY